MIQNRFEYAVGSSNRQVSRQIIKIAFCYCLLLSCLACFQPSIPFASARTTYPIDVFFNDEAVSRPYEVIQKLETRQEVPLTPGQSREGRMLARGNNVEQKELLIAQMVVDAKAVGADALVNVRYRYYTTQTANGYSLEGLAVRYRGD